MYCLCPIATCCFVVSLPRHNVVELDKDILLCWVMIALSLKMPFMTVVP